MKKLLAHKITGTTSVKIPNGHKLGSIFISSTSSGVGSVVIYDGQSVSSDRVCAALHSYQYTGTTLDGPFFHNEDILTAVVDGTGCHADIYSWCP